LRDRLVDRAGVEPAT